VKLAFSFEANISMKKLEYAKAHKCTYLFHMHFPWERRKCVKVWEVVPKIPKCILTFENLESHNFETRFEGLKLVQIGIFIIPLERFWRIDIQNRVACPIWILKIHLMTNWMVGSQTSNFESWPLIFVIDEPNHL
jgi:hypothetical protein